MSARPNWHEDVFFGLHYDQHAGAEDTVLGKEMSHEHLREMLSRVMPDWVQCDCKGHAGWTSWPTEVGSTSPGVVRDQVRAYRDVTRELGLKLGMHYSGVWDSRAVELHPEWGRVEADGSRNPNMTCRLSAYDDELMIPQMLELVEKYDVDGFWVDGENWASAPCWCEACQAEFAKRTGLAEIPHAKGEPNWDAWLAFHRDLFVEHVTYYADAVHARKPDCLICSNWMYTIRQPDPVTATVDYLSGDYDWVWGADRAAVEGRLLDGRGMTWDLMAWGFTKSGDMNAALPWVMKTATNLCQELVEVVALGGAVMVYNTPQRTGWLTGWHQDLLGEVATFCRARQDICFKSKSIPQAAILHLSDSYYADNDPLYNYGNAVQPIEGALHALLETQRSTDILTEADALKRLSAYKLVVVPEQTRLSADIKVALEDFAHAGGQVILSGAHLAEECSDLVGATAIDGEALTTCWLPVDSKAVGVFGPWATVQAGEGVETLACLMTQQEPSKDTTDQPAITRRKVGEGAIVAVHGPIFRNYFQGHYPLLRRFIGELVSGLGVDWSVRVQAPARLEVVLREKDGKTLVNLINRGAAEMTNPRRVIVEELCPVTNVLVHLKRAVAPQSVTLTPGSEPVVWDYVDGEVVVKVPRVGIHSVVVVE